MVKEKKKKQPFWKKTSPELKHVTDHIGKVIDNSKLSDFLDFTINAGLAYAGFRVFNDWKGALIGPIALKLATSRNLVAGSAGVIMLTGLGFCIGSSGIQEFIQDPIGSWNRDMEALMSGIPVYTEPTPEGQCENGRVLMERQGVQICVDSWRVMGYERWGWRRI